MDLLRIVFWLVFAILNAIYQLTVGIALAVAKELDSAQVVPVARRARAKRPVRRVLSRRAA